MLVRVYDIEIIGQQPLLMHADDIEWADKMEEWKNDKDNKKKSKAGDDRTPSYRWVGYVYLDAGKVVIPTENIMRAMMEGAAMVPVPGGRSGKTFKAQSQSGILPVGAGWPLIIDGEELAFGKIEKLKGIETFADHVAAVQELGFRLLVKRARIGQQKHIRVRPMFVDWSARGSVMVQDDQITESVLADILSCAGTYKGLGDWRPGSKTPGTYGTFASKVTLAKSEQKKAA